MVSPVDASQLADVGFEVASTVAHRTAGSSVGATNVDSQPTPGQRSPVLRQASLADDSCTLKFHCSFTSIDR